MFTIGAYYPMYINRLGFPDHQDFDHNEDNFIYSKAI